MINFADANIFPFIVRMNSQSVIRNIIFDMGGVLVRLCPERCIAAFCAIGARRTASYVEEFRTEDLFLDIETGSKSTAEFCDEVRRINGINVPDSKIISAWNSLLSPPGDEERSSLLRLRGRGMRLFVLSNTCDMHWQYASRELIPSPGKTISDYFERAFLSFEMHKRKPSADIFDDVLRLAGISPEATLFIDDNETNLSAAHATGIKVFHECKSRHWTDVIPRLLL